METANAIVLPPPVPPIMVIDARQKRCRMNRQWLVAGFLTLGLFTCGDVQPPDKQKRPVPSALAKTRPAAPPAQDWSETARNVRLPFSVRLSAAALERSTHQVTYDPTYLKIPYPLGDVPPTQGVCTDEVIRAYRTLGIDLQKLVHEDMARNFARYPNPWGRKRPDTNIDHRRVPNLQVFFARKGRTLPVTKRGEDYRAGEIVTWMLPGGLPHIGLTTVRRSIDGLRPLIVHNIGRGPQLEDMLFSYTVTGHYAYGGP